MLRVSLLIQAVERVTGPVRRITASIKTMSREGTRDIGRLSASMAALRAIAGRAGAGIASGLRNGVRAAVSGARASLSGFLSAFNPGGWEGLGRRLGGALRSGLMYGITGIVAAGSYMVYRLTTGVIETGSLFEQLGITLANQLGSRSAAARAMDWIQNFAQRTPYELNEVMEAFKQMQVLDFNPMSGSLEAIGNAASALGFQLSDAVQAVASAAAGEFEPLRRYGIRISKHGQQLTLMYRQNGREFTRTIRDNQAELERTVSEIFNTRFPHMMDQQSASMAGIWSNLMDQITRFQRMIADAGVFDYVKAQLQGLLDRVNALGANGTLQRWARQIAQWLQRAARSAVDFLANTDWVEVGRQVQEVAQAFWTLARAVAAVVGPMARLADLASNFTQFTPWWQALRVISGQGVGFRVSVPIPQSWGSGGDGAAAPRPMPRGGIPGLPGYGPPRAIPRPWALRPGPAAPSLAPLRGPRAEVGGSLNIRLTTPPGTSAQVTGLRSANSNVPINVTRGFAGAAPA